MKCKRCEQEKALTDFYTNDKTCKDCRKTLAKENRAKNLDYYLEYDRKRANNPDRIEARKRYSQTEEGRTAKQRALKSYQERFPLKRAAHIITGNAIKSGKLVRPNAYESCGSTEKIEAHHDDYTKPLSVRWLCERCHKEWHRHNEPLYA